MGYGSRIRVSEREPMDTSLMAGWLSWLILAAGVAGLALLLARRERWWLYLVPAVVVVSAIAAWLIGTIGGEKLFAAPLKSSDIVWIGAALAAVGLAVGHLAGTGWRRKVLAAIAAVVVVVAAGNQINKSYQEYPTVTDLFGPSQEEQAASLPPVTPSAPPAALPDGPLTTTWMPTGAQLPADGKGKVVPFIIPNTQSGFAARPGWVYLPPAYYADNRVPLPVVVLFHGQPGSPDDWITGNRVQPVMDDFAARHNGIAPIVVMPDVLGSQLANPLCADTSRGNADTYLAKDLPAAIEAQLEVDGDHRHWVVGGFSYGGTCALQMATNHPDLYPNFIDISGQQEPTLGSGDTARKTTVDGAFGGDEARFIAINPADLMRTKQFPDSSGWFIWGAADAETKAAQLSNAALARAAGMNVQTWEVPDTGHDWGTVSTALPHVMPWIATRTGLTG